jgi:hypothetical protein
MNIFNGAAYLVAVLALSLSPISAKASEAKKLTYAVYTGGMNVVMADLDFKFSDDASYSALVSAKTHGFLGKVAPWSGTFETTGHYKGEKFFPNVHTSVAVWRGEDDQKAYDYDGKGNLTDFKEVEAGKTKPKKELSAELIKDTTDILSATLKVMHNMGRGESCSSSEDIFDGKRRFALKFEPVSETILKSSRYNMYGGEAKKCQIMVEPKGGKWHKKPRGWMSIQEQGRDSGALPTIWLGKLKDSDLFVPVKVKVKTAYGTLMMHLVSSE